MTNRQLAILGAVALVGIIIIVFFVRGTTTVPPTPAPLGTNVPTSTVRVAP